MRSRNHKGNVFVGNLPTDFSDERLAEAFDPFGIVLSAAIARDPATGARLRYGFVDIATEKAAKAAIAGLDGTKIDGSKLSVQLSEKPAKKTPGARPAAKRPRLAPSAAPRMPPHDGEPGFAAPPRIPHRDAGEPGFAATPREGNDPVFPAAPRPQPSFQVERRPLRPLARRLTPQ
jgi:RNA recognition motif-containing protein